MSKLSNAAAELRSMDRLAAGDTFLHRRHPLAKLAVTILYIAVLLSFPHHSLSAMVPLILVPLCLSLLGELSLTEGLYRLRFVLPLVVFLGIFDPILERETLFTLGSIGISAGWVGFLDLLLKGVLALLAAYLLMASTGMDRLCGGLALLRLPESLLTLLLLTYRYLALMVEELSIMTDAYRLRAPGQKGIHPKAWGSFLGQLLLRSRDRAEEIYGAMMLRGFSGRFLYSRPAPWNGADTLFLLLFAAFIVLCRFLDLPVMLGGLFL